MNNYLEQKLLKLGYPTKIAKEMSKNKDLQKEERITDRILNK